MHQKTNLTDIFADTMARCAEDPLLAEAVKNSIDRQIVLLETDTLDVPEGNKFTEPANVIVSKKRTFEAAVGYKDKGGKVCVLNFANPVNQGGGVARGAVAQEECLCRCSTLYPCLAEPTATEKFYSAHRKALNSGKMGLLFNDDCIYTPNVVVFKSDTFLPEPIPESGWYKTDVITCAAPNLSRVKDGVISEERFRHIHYRRGKRILELAKAQEVDHLVLGAFGCGAFRNPPEVVAEVYKQLVEEFKFEFRTVEFAIYCASYETENYKVFAEKLA